MIDAVTLQMNDYLPLRDVVFQTLREAILKGKLLPGERLMEIHLAQQLGVSRTPVREAIRKLELEGLVTMMPRKGAVVAEITVSELEDVLEVRKTLENLAVARACRNDDPEKLEELSRAEEKFRKTLGGGDLMEAALADEQFHEVIYQMNGNRKLVQILSNLREQMYRFRIEYLKDVESYTTLMQEHNELRTALEHGDEELAQKVISQHVDRQRACILESIKTGRR